MRENDLRRRSESRHAGSVTLEIRGGHVKILVAGASGAIGRPLTKALIAAKHEVVGIATNPVSARTLRALGAEGVVLNVLEADAVHREVERFHPDAIINELTSLPTRYTPEELRAAAPRDRKVRLEGGRNLLDAALSTGVKTFSLQSSGFYYGPGPGFASETGDLADYASPGIARTVATYRELEGQLFSHPSLRGIALRYGFFYGPGTYYDFENGSWTLQVRNGQYPLIEPGSGVFSFIHVEDAAMATVAALEIPSGVYNVVDDDPSPMAEWLPAFAKFIGAPAPERIGEEEGLRRNGADAVYYALQLRGASNAKVKSHLRFSPRRLEWLGA